MRLHGMRLPDVDLHALDLSGVSFANCNLKGGADRKGSHGGNAEGWEEGRRGQDRKRECGGVTCGRAAYRTALFEF